MRIRRGWAGLGVCLLALGLAACGSSSSNRKSEPTGSDAGAGAEANGGSVSGGSVSAGGGGKAGNISDDTSGAGGSEAGAPTEGGTGAAGDLVPVPSELRRLTASEYSATVQDVLGTTLEPNLDGFATEVDGFDNNAAANGVSEALYLRYLETAEQLADEVFASSTLRAQVVSCELVDDVACVRQIAAGVGLRLFRQPLLDEELDAYQDAYERARERELAHEDAVKEMLIALLASAQFLYRMEYVPAEVGARPVSAHELATRLSYLLWSSAPDAELLQAAERDDLGTDEQLEQSALRLLNDPKAERFTLGFAGQWLGARRVQGVEPEAQLYPAWTPAVANAAAAEIYAHFKLLLDEERDFRELLESRAHFVDASLAPFYGLPSPGGVATWVELNGVERQGFLGLVGFLAVNATETRSAPSRRGRFILQHLLCQPIGTAPQDMPLYAGGEAAIRDHLEGVSEQAGCAFCHSQIDPLGLALENYDAIGRFRTVYQNAAVIDPSVTLEVAPALPAASSVSGIGDLSQALRESSAFTTCVAQKLYTYGMGRTVTAGERPNVEALTSQWQASSPSLRELILSLVLSPTFRQRSDGGAQ